MAHRSWNHASCSAKKSPHTRSFDTYFCGDLRGGGPGAHPTIARQTKQRVRVDFVMLRFFTHCVCSTTAASFAPLTLRAPSPRRREEGQVQSSAGCLSFSPHVGRRCPEGEWGAASKTMCPAANQACPPSAPKTANSPMPAVARIQSVCTLSRSASR